MTRSVSGFACGKIILFGEHAVVYGRPAIAVPVTQVRAEAKISVFPNASVMVDAADISRRYLVSEAARDDPIATITRLTCEKLSVEPKGFSIRIHSTIPNARGLGSGAAVSVAIVHALAKYFERTLSTAEISALAFEVEKLHHGTPSGIDNTVVAYERPIRFQREHPLETLLIPQPFLIAIADTGIVSPTKIAVGDVRRGWEKERERYEKAFDEIGGIVDQSWKKLEVGEILSLGSLMLKNQRVLQDIGVSTPTIEEIIDAAVGAGAEGAKLSGAGRGGNVIALVDEETRQHVERAMRRAGARQVFVTRVGEGSSLEGRQQ